MPKLLTVLSIVTGISILSWGWWDVYQHRKKPAIPVLRLQFANGKSLTFVLEPIMRKISSSIAHFIMSIAGLTAAGVSAAVDSVITVVSSDPNVLQVEPLVDGSHRVTVTGVGQATLTVYGDADLGDGLRTINQVFEFDVYDGAGEDDHFDLVITDIVRSDAINPHAVEGDASATETDSSAS